jgi:hypothetical protein
MVGHRVGRVFFAHRRYTAEVTDVFVMAAYRIHAALMLIHHTDEKMPRFITWRADPEDTQAVAPRRDARDKVMREVWALNITNIRGKAPQKNALAALLHLQYTAGACMKIRVPDSPTPFAVCKAAKIMGSKREEIFKRNTGDPVGGPMP